MTTPTPQAQTSGQGENQSRVVTPLSAEELARWRADNAACVQPSWSQARLYATIDERDALLTEARAERDKFKGASEAGGAFYERAESALAKAEAESARLREALERVMRLPQHAAYATARDALLPTPETGEGK